ncbi:MAG: fibronectin type III-like domain-contianing protein, partial [Gracilimonas sp.]
EEKVVYEEGLLVGYRWFDTKNTEPLYPFGYGLSYTDFEYGDPSTQKSVFSKDEKIKVTVPVTNTGDIDGKETVQLYVQAVNSSVMRPAKELKGFTKVNLESGSTQETVIELNVSDLAYFDDETMSWTVEPGEYKLLVGTSSRDIRCETIITVN